MIFLSVALVGLTALFLGFNAQDQSEITNFHGAASLDANYPTYSGMLSLLEDMCYLKNSEGDSCNSVCEGFDQICIPLKQTCDVGFTGQCRCCDYPR